MNAEKQLRAGLGIGFFFPFFFRPPTFSSFFSLNLHLKTLLLKTQNSCITFFQQVGFASLESGSVRAKNTRNVLLKVK